MKTLILLLIGAATMCAQPTFTAQDLPSVGLRFSRPTDANYNGVIHSIGLGKDPAVSQWLNYSVVLTNNELRGRGIVALGTKWTLIDAQGHTTIKLDRTQTLFDFKLGQNRRLPGGKTPHIKHGDWLFISPMFMAGPLQPAPGAAMPASIYKQFASTINSVSVQIDYAILEDGTVLGPDSMRGSVVPLAQVNARRTVQIVALHEIKRGWTPQQVLDHVQRVATKYAAQVTTLGFRENFNAEMGAYAQSIVDIRRSAGDAEALEELTSKVYIRPVRFHR